MGARPYVVSVSASILAFLALATAAVAAPPDDSTNFADDPFLLESDYPWTANTAGYDTYDGEPGTPSNANPDDPDSDCDPEGMRATSWWQIHGTGRPILITTDLPGTNYDTIMAIYEEDSANNLPGDYVGCIDDISDSNRRSEVTLDPNDPDVDYWIQVGGFNGATGMLRIGASSDAPGNDGRDQAEPIAPGPQSFWENFGATPVGANEVCGNTPLAKSVWFRYTTPERGNVSVDVVGLWNIVVGVYRGSQAAALGCGNNFGTTTARAASGDQDADTYFIQVGAAADDNDYFDNFDADEEVFGIEVSFTPDPDDDDDGVLDGADRCPRDKGTGLSRDCPDPDSDTFADSIDDRCPGLGGNDATKYQGCPDEDRDGVPEGPGGRDGCPGANAQQLGRRDRNSDGCPDTLLVHNLVKLRRSVVFADGRGVRLQEFAVTGVPAGARVVIICKLPNGRRCGGITVRRASVLAQAAKTVRPRNLQGDVVPFGTQITTRVTARFATGSFIRWTAARNSQGFRERRFCMNSGSRKLRPIRRGCR